MSDQPQMSAGLFEEIHFLTHACLEDTATSDEIIRLDRLLATNPTARQTYLRYVYTSNSLRNWAGYSDRDACKANSISEGKAPSFPVLGFLGDLVGQGWGFVSGHTTFFSVLAALLVVVALAAMILCHGEGGRRKATEGSELANQPSNVADPKSEIPGPKHGAPVARLTHSVESQWEHTAPPLAVGDALAIGQKINLCSGAIELTFDVGVRAVIQGPAELDLLAPGKVFLHAGKMSAEILTPKARGFEVQTPKGSIVDLGTEFGIDVTPSHDVQVHVFKGEVVVQQPAPTVQRPSVRQPAGPTAPAAEQHLFVNQGLRMEGGLPLSLVKDSGETFIRTINDATRDRHVVAYWRFEDRPLGTKLPDTKGNTRPIRATVDSSFNGNDLYTFATDQRPTFSSDVPAGVVPQIGSPNRSCLDTTRPKNQQRGLDVYTHSEFSHAAPLDIQKIAPAQWTIEASVNSAEHSGKAQTFLVRDTYYALKFRNDPPRLAFRIDARQRFSITYFDVQNREHQAVAEEPLVEANRWYHVAAASDGRTLRLYVDAFDGRGYRLQATTSLPTEGSTALGKGEDDAEWSIGRGHAGDGTGEFFSGLIDEVRVSDVALSPSEFLFAPKRRGTN